MIPFIIGALGLIAYGLSEENNKPKAVKKMAKGGGLSTEEQNRFDELDEKMNAYLEGKAQVSSKEMSEHAKLKFKRNLAKYPLLKKQVEWESKTEINSESKMSKGGKIYSSDNMFIVKVYDLKDNERYLGEHKFRAKNIFEAKKMLADEVGDDIREKFGKYLDFELIEAPSLMSKGGKIKNLLKEDDYVWNAVGKKLIVDKVTEDEYYLTSFMQKGSSPFSKKKVDEYIKKGQWTLKPKTKMAKGGALDTKIDALYEKSGFINDDYNWKSKLIEMLQDSSVEAYQIYQKLTAKEKKDVLQELFEMDNDMGSYGDEDIATSKENLSILLSDAKKGKKYGNGGNISGFEANLKKALKENNKWHFISENVDGKNVQLKMYVGAKEVDVQIFKINGIHHGKMNYQNKTKTLAMIMGELK